MQHVEIVHVINVIVRQTTSSSNSKVQFAIHSPFIKFTLVCPQKTRVIHILRQIHVSLITAGGSMTLLPSVETSFEGLLRKKHLRIADEVLCSVLQRLREISVDVIFVGLVHQVSPRSQTVHQVVIHAHIGRGLESAAAAVAPIVVDDGSDALVPAVVLVLELPVDGAAPQVQQRRRRARELALNAVMLVHQVGFERLVQLEDLFGLEEIRGEIVEVVLVGIESGAGEFCGVGLRVARFLHPAVVGDLVELMMVLVRIVAVGGNGVVVYRRRVCGGISTYAFEWGARTVR